MSPGVGASANGCPKVAFDFRDNIRRRARSTKARLVLNAVPLRRVMRRRNHHTASGATMTHTER